MNAPVFVSPKMDLRSNGDQLEEKAILKYEFKKPPKGCDNPLRGFTESFFENPTFSFWPQKVRGLLAGFTWIRGRTTIKRYAYGNR
jgi:hypothetical protein